MAISKNDGQQLTVSAPYLYNSSFANAAARLAPNLLRHVAWVSSQDDDGSKWTILPQAQCFLSDGTTPVTQHGTWGTLDAHWERLWIPYPSLNLRNAVVSGFTAMGGSATVLTPALASAPLVAEQTKDMFFTDDVWDYWYTFVRNGTLQWSRTYKSGTAAQGGGGTSSPELVRVANFAALPTTGDATLLYITEDTGYEYEWRGSAYAEISSDAAARQLIGTVANLKTVQKTNLVGALNEVYDQTTSAYSIQLANGSLAKYPTSSAAVNAMTAADTLVLRGPQGSLTLGTTIDMDMYGAAFGSSTLQFLYGPPDTTVINQRVRGFSSNGRVVVARHNATCSLLIEDAYFDIVAWFELYALLSGSADITTVTLRRCRGVRSQTKGAEGQGNIIFQARDDAGQYFTLYLDDCDFRNTMGSIFTGYLHPATRIYLQGRTKLTPAAGSPLLTMTYVSTTTPVVATDIIVDQRVQRTGSVLEFNQDAEYTPITSGTFTVNTATKIVGSTVFAYLASGTTAPTLDSAVFQNTGGTYASNTNLMYGFKVGGNGKIQYTITALT